MGRKAWEIQNQSSTNQKLVTQLENMRYKYYPPVKERVSGGFQYQTGYYDYPHGHVPKNVRENSLSFTKSMSIGVGSEVAKKNIKKLLQKKQIKKYNFGTAKMLDYLEKNQYLKITDLASSGYNIYKAKDKSKASAVEIIGYGAGMMGEKIGEALIFNARDKLISMGISVTGIAAAPVVLSVGASYLFTKWMENGQYDKMKKNMHKRAIATKGAVESNYYAFEKRKEKGYIYQTKPTKKQKKQRVSAGKRFEKRMKKMNKYLKSFFFPNQLFRYAEGGFVNKTTLGYVGEDGPEVIIPISGKRRQQGIDLWERTGEKLGITQEEKRKVYKKKKSENINLLELLEEQRGQVSDELCSIVADALESAYQNIPMVLL